MARALAEYVPSAEPGRETIQPLRSRLVSGIRYRYTAKDGSVFEVTAINERFARGARDAWKVRRACRLPL